MYSTLLLLKKLTPKKHHKDSLLNQSVVFAFWVKTNQKGTRMTYSIIMTHLFGHDTWEAVLKRFAFALFCKVAVYPNSRHSLAGRCSSSAWNISCCIHMEETGWNWCCEPFEPHSYNADTWSIWDQVEMVLLSHTAKTPVCVSTFRTHLVSLPHGGLAFASCVCACEGGGVHCTSNIWWHFFFTFSHKVATSRSLKNEHWLHLLAWHTYTM